MSGPVTLQILSRISKYRAEAIHNTWMNGALLNVHFIFHSSACAIYLQYFIDDKKQTDLARSQFRTIKSGS